MSMTRNHLEKISDQDRIKCIPNAKGDLFFHYRYVKYISFYNFRDTKFCVKHEKRNLNSIYIAGLMFVW